MTVSNAVTQWLEKLKKADSEREQQRNIPAHVVTPKVQEIEVNHKEGFIYILKSSNGYYKIGRAKNVQTRVSAWKTFFPIKINMVYSFACHNRMAVENALHNKYAKKRVQREWYKLEKDDVSYLMTVKDYELG